MKVTYITTKKSRCARSQVSLQNTPPSKNCLHLSYIKEIKGIKKKKDGNRFIHSNILMRLELRTFVIISHGFRVSKVWLLRRFEEREVQRLKKTVFSKSIFK